MTRLFVTVASEGRVCLCFYLPYVQILRLCVTNKECIWRRCRNFEKSQGLTSEDTALAMGSRTQAGWEVSRKKSIEGVAGLTGCWGQATAEESWSILVSLGRLATQEASDSELLFLRGLSRRVRSCTSSSEPQPSNLSGSPQYHNIACQLSPLLFELWTLLP